MQTITPKTTGEVAAQFNVPEWAVRRIVDAIDADVPRAGRFRLIFPSMLGPIETELRRQGRIPEATAHAG